MSSPSTAVPGDAANAAAAEQPTGSTIPPLDMTTPQLTLRAVLTGAFLGAVLSSCNIYTGFTIGWGLNMSLTAILISFAFWKACQHVFRAREWTLLENNINQAACSAGAAVSSAGLVAPIPALTLLTGQELGWLPLSIWVTSVCMVGIVVAIPLRRQLIEVDKLPFPAGLANGEMLREMYAHGSEAMIRVRVMIFSAILSASLMVLRTYPVVLEWILTPLTWIPSFKPRGARIEAVPLAIPPAWIGGFQARNLGFTFDPSLLFIAVGGLIGFRGCVSLLGGSIFAWLILAPPLIHNGSIRLTVREPLRVLPAEIDPNVALPPIPQGFTHFERELFMLEHKGQMSLEQRDRLLALSAEPTWREAVQKLYVRSQFGISGKIGEALGASAGAIDPARHAGIAQRGIDRTTQAALLDGNAGAAELAALFDYTTTREIQVSEPLAALPDDLTIPRDVAAVLRYDPLKQRLIAFGVLPDAARDRMNEHLDALGQEHPDLSPTIENFRTTLHKLHAHTNTPYFPDGVTIPAALAGVVEIDDAQKRIIARGVLLPEDAATLKAVMPPDNPNAEDFYATIDRVVAGSTLRPVAPGYSDVVEWLMWPGVTLMVVASLVAFSFSWPAMARAFRVARTGAAASPGDVGLRWFLVAALGALIFATVTQHLYFGIPIWIGVIAVLLTFVLALVAARVTGETNTTPVGAMGKVTQLAFGVVSPGSPEANLMTANITGGAASQCGDLMHDLKTTHMIGGTPWKVVIAQMVGAAAGAFAGSAWYLILIPHPREQLVTDQWPAPAVVAWKAVAELFQVGLQALPPGSLMAIAIAAAFGVLLPILDRFLPRKAALFVPSPAAVGLAFVINGHTAIGMFIGGVLALVATTFFKRWSSRFLVAICAGLVAGESLTGVGVAVSRMPIW